MLLATLTLFPNALRRAAVGTSEFIENFSAGDVPRLLEASEEASSAEELGDGAVIFSGRRRRGLDEQSGGGHAGRRRRAARDEIQGRIEEIEAIQNYVDSAEDFAALEARIAAIDAELADPAADDDEADQPGGADPHEHHGQPGTRTAGSGTGPPASPGGQRERGPHHGPREHGWRTSRRAWKCRCRR